MIIEQQIPDAWFIESLTKGRLHLGISTPEIASKVREALKQSGFHFIEGYDYFNGDWNFLVFSSEEAKNAEEEANKK